MPNRRDTVSLAMIRHMIDTRGNDPDSLDYALTDFQILSHYVGLRLGEYTQTKNNKITRTKNQLMPKSFVL